MDEIYRWEKTPTGGVLRHICRRLFTPAVVIFDYVELVLRVKR